MPAYDADDMTLSLVGRKVALLRKFGNDAFTDELLQQELTLNTNHGLTRPQQQLTRIMKRLQLDEVRNIPYYSTLSPGMPPCPKSTKSRR